MTRIVGFILLFGMTHLNLLGQIADWSTDVVEHHPTKMYAPQQSSALADVLNRHRLLKLPSYTYKEVSRKQSLTGTHISYSIAKDGIPIKDAQLRVHLSKSGEVRYVQDNIPEIHSHASNLAYKSGAIWVRVHDEWMVGSLDRSYSAEGQHPIKIDGSIVDYQRFRHFFQDPDTTADARVFLVNPTSSAEVSYGGQYADSNDKDLPALNAERKWVNMPVWFEQDTFWLKSKRYYFDDISDPVTPQTYALTDTFDFTRSQYQFEDVNAFYHVTNMSRYVERLGYSSALPDTLVIDAHAHGGADFSSFNYGIYPLELEFGEGGVDDAEDGKIVVHEFAHALAHLAGGDSYSPTRDRGAMEEGNADYFSASYSRAYTDFDWKKMFNWDMHNEFFPNGVTIGAPLQYPGDMKNSTNHDREIWSTPLMCLYEKLGRETCDSLVLEHLYYQAKNATIPQMANVLLMVDSMLFDERYARDIRDCFAVHNVLANVTEVVAFQSAFTSRNSYAFAHGTDDLVLETKDGRPFQAALFSVSGQEVNRWTDVASLQIAPTSLKPGMYVVRLQVDGLRTAHKIIRY